MKNILFYVPKKVNRKKLLLWGIPMFLIILSVYTYVNTDIRALRNLTFVHSIQLGVDKLHYIKENTKIQDEQTQEQALKNISLARVQFLAAKEDVASIDPLHLRAIPWTPFHSADQSIDLLLQSTHVIEEGIGLIDQCMKQLSPDCISIYDIDNFVERYQEMSEALYSINTTFFPLEAREKILDLKTQFKQIDSLVSWYSDNQDEIHTIFGSKKPQGYLVVLQNSTEARPTGGYIGSMLYVQMHQGKVVESRFVDPHYFDFKTGAYVDAPDYLKFIKRISIQESNYSLSISDSGQRLIDNFHEMRGATTDGVVFISFGILERVFDLFPEVEWNDQVLTKENYFTYLQWEIEYHNLDEFEKRKNPKEKYFEFVESILQKAIQCNCFEEMLAMLPEVLETKQIQMYSTQEDVQSFFQRENIISDVEISSIGNDFFSLVFSSYFNKSNTFIEKKVQHDTQEYDQYYETTVQIELEHIFDEEQENRILQIIPELESLSENSHTYIFNTFGGGEYNMFMEIMIPAEAENIEPSYINDQEVEVRTDELTIVGITDVIQPEQKRIYKLQYTFPKTKNYELFIHSQPDQEYQLEKNYFNSHKIKKELYNNVLIKNEIIN